MSKYCPKCGWKINYARDNYCSYCGHTLRNISIIIPDKIFAGIPFKVLFRVKGQYKFTLTKMVIEDIEIFNNNLSIDENTPVEEYVSYPNHTAYQKDALLVFVFDDGFVVKLKANLNPKPTLHLHIQKTQEIDIFSANDHIIYLSRQYDDLRISLKCTNEISDLKITINELLFPLEEIAGVFSIQDAKWNKCIEELEKNNGRNSGNISILSSKSSFKYNAEVTFVLINLPKIRLTGLDEKLNNFLYLNKNQSITFRIDREKNEQESTDLIDIKLTTLTKNTSLFNSERMLLDSELIENRLQFNNIKEHQLSSTLGGKIFNVKIKISLSLVPDNKILTYIQDYDFLVKDENDMEELDFIVIDLGTSNSCIAYGDSIDNINFLEAKIGDSVRTELQTTITLKNIVDESFNYPSQMEYFQSWNPTNPILGFADNFKILLKENAQKLYRDNNDNSVILTPEKLIELYLKETLNELAKVNYKTSKALFTFPAFDLNYYKQKLSAIAKLVGLETHECSKLSEPEAIAIYYITSIMKCSDQNELKELLSNQDEILLAVFDCGGGTTDISIVSLKPNDQKIEILANWGTNQFSGNYITYLMVKDEYDYNDDILNLQTYNDVLMIKDLSKRKKYLEFAQQMEIRKRDSSNNSYFTNLLTSPINSSYDKIDEIVSKLYLQNIITKSNLDVLILAGNTVRLDVFSQIAKSKFNDTYIIYDKEQLKDSVVKGAFIYAHELDGNIEVMGLSKTSKSYYYIEMKGFNPEEQKLFDPWLDKDVEHHSHWIDIKPRSKKDFVIYSLDDPLLDVNTNKKIHYRITPPPEDVIELQYQFKLFNDKMQYHIQMTKPNGEKVISEYKNLE